MSNNKSVKYGKSSQSMISLKENFFKNNDEILEKMRGINKYYSQQPDRFNCKNCNQSLGVVSFRKQYVDYTLCENCGHLNGMYDDTESFCKKLYTDSKGADYAETYNSRLAKEFNQRVKDIYVPKAKFLCDSLVDFGHVLNELKYADFGAGSGYFVSALKFNGLNNVIGFEPSESQVSLGKKMIGEDLLELTSLKDTVNKIKTIDVDVISMIGVLEHVQNPREIISAISKNKKIKYLYISVPLFSISVYFEMVFPKVINRHLSGAHTHLYTEESLKYMAKEFNLDIVASWWFGTDMVDLFRSVTVCLDKDNDTSKMKPKWMELFTPVIDELQLKLDEKHMSSEVHMIFKVN